jgi:hypothetical protein
MNPKSYRILTKPISTRVRCPVCHEEVYSRAGIHPQCAVRQSEPPRSKTKEPVAPALAEPIPAAPGQPEGALDLLTPEILAAQDRTPL